MNTSYGEAVVLTRRMRIRWPRSYWRGSPTEVLFPRLRLTTYVPEGEPESLRSLYAESFGSRSAYLCDARPK